MKTRIVVAALALSLGLAARAWGVTQDVTLTATVPEFCSIGGSGTAGTAVTRSIAITTAGQPSASQVTATGIGTVVCNANAELSMSSLNGGVKHASASATATLTNAFNYRADVTYNSSSISGTTAGTAGSFGTTATTTAGASSSSVLDVKITPVAGTLPLIVGSYSDTLTVTVTPKP
jgi:hypothetical protein